MDNNISKYTYCVWVSTLRDKQTTVEVRCLCGSIDRDACTDAGKDIMDGDAEEREDGSKA
jgi:hypothetical protein